jgi:hypothetical protein
MIAVAATVLLAGCSESPTLTLAEKTRYVAELIAERAECDHFYKELQVPAKDFKSLDAIYQAAKAAYCLKPDV